jgi:KTSC domain-containing protein
MGEPPLQIKRQKVESSTIRSIGYDSETKTLAVEFIGNGHVWRYAGVSAEKYSRFAAASSKGCFFSEYIRGKYRGVNTGTDEPARPVEPDKFDYAVSAPCWLALVKTKKAMGRDYGKVLYWLWVSCGKPEKKTNSENVYTRCLQLISEASGVDRIGGQYVAAAIQLAKQRRV